MAKQKSFHTKVMQRIKRLDGITWSRELTETVGDPLPPEAFETAGQSKELIDTRFMTLQEEADIAILLDSMLGGNSDATRQSHPGLIVSWCTTPATADMTPLFAETLKFPTEGVLDVPFEGLNKLFPSCMLVDIRGLNVEIYGLSLDAMFIYPSFDEDRGYAMLLLVALDSRKGLADALFSKLVLHGETFQDAFDYSVHERNLLNKRWFSGLDTGAHGEVFAPFEDEELVLEIAARMFALAFGERGSFAKITRDEGFHVMFCMDGEDVQGLSPEELDAIAALEPVDDSFDIENEGSEPEGTIEPDDAAEFDADAPVFESFANDASDQSESDSDGDEGDQGQPQAPLVCPGEAFAQLAVQAQSERELELELRIEELSKQLASQTAANAALSYHLSQAQNSTNDLREQVAALSKRATFAERMEIPTTAFESLALAQEAFADRIIVTERAYKSAQAFTKGDASEVWNVMRSIATVLHPLVFQGGSHNMSRAFLSQTGFELALREGKLTNANAARAQQRMIEYEGAMRDATPHVKGKGTKKGETLRVHFFADYDKGKLVIAHCGEHLETAETSKL